MPGYLIHLAASPKDIRTSPLGLLGLIAPDWWRNKRLTKEEYDFIFSEYADAPTFDEIELLCSKTSGGTHFETNPMSIKNVNFGLLKSLLLNHALNPKSIFMKGYMQHLRVDYLFYRNHNIYDESAYIHDYTIDKTKAMKTLHSDWDNMNLTISRNYPELPEMCVRLPHDLQEIIKFSCGTPVYVNEPLMLEFIDTMRENTSSIFDILPTN